MIDLSVVLILWLGSAASGYWADTMNTASWTGAWPFFARAGLALLSAFLFFWGLEEVSDL